MAVRKWNPSRRDFLKQASMLALSSGIAIPSVAAQTANDRKFVSAETAFGRIRGLDVGGIKIFKGVPYGADTSGKNRFMPPVDPGKWTGVRDALEFGHSAPQTEPGTRRNTSDLAVAGAGLGSEGEDCLVLNIWTPAINDGGKRPVMLWCHGGGFSSGSGSSPVTEGANLARPRASCQFEVHYLHGRNRIYGYGGTGRAVIRREGPRGGSATKVRFLPLL